MSERRWSDEEAREACYSEQMVSDGVESDFVVIGRALLTARERAEKAEALVAVLKAEVKAWRVFEDHPANDQLSMECIVEWRAVVNARAATDALGGVE